MANENITLNDLINQLAILKVDLSEKIDEKINNLQFNLDKKFTNAINEVKADINIVSTRQDELEGKYEKIDRQLHLTDLLLHGIPKMEKEDLRCVMARICSKIGYTSMDYNLLSVFRLHLKTTKPSIILKFISLMARNEFYQLYKDILKTDT